MKALFLLTNSACNISCTYCFYATGHEERTRARIRPQAAQRVAQRIASVGFYTVILTGGDPLHVRYKHETYLLVRKLKERGIRVIINTSGVYLDPHDLDTLVALDVDRIDISIDSHDPIIHNAQRGRHADTYEAIRGLLERGYMRVAATIVVTRLNAPTLIETVRWLHDIGVRDVRMQRAFFPDGSSEQDECIVNAMRATVAHLAQRHTERYVALTERAFTREDVPEGAQCRMGKEYFVCTADGVLTPCFHRSDIVLGNLFEDPVDALIGSLGNHDLLTYDVPPCFGAHCASLFDIPRFWRMP